MTPEEIIDSLPEGNRKRACVIIAGVAPGLTNDFWDEVAFENWQGAVQALHANMSAPFINALSDMIWEG